MKIGPHTNIEYQDDELYEGYTPDETAFGALQAGPTTLKEMAALLIATARQHLNGEELQWDKRGVLCAAALIDMLAEQLVLRAVDEAFAESGHNQEEQA